MGYRILKSYTIIFLCTISCFCGSAQISPQLQKTLEISQNNKVNVILEFQDKADLNETQDTKPHTHNAKLITRLRKHAQLSAAPVETLLKKEAVRFKLLWTINAVAFEADTKLIKRLERLPINARIRLDEVITLEEPPVTLLSVPVETNIDLVRAAEMWDIGFDGTGTVVEIGRASCRERV